MLIEPCEECWATWCSQVPANGAPCHVVQQNLHCRFNLNQTHLGTCFVCFGVLLSWAQVATCFVCLFSFGNRTSDFTVRKENT